MWHNSWACALEPRNCNYWAHMLQLLKLGALEPVLHNKGSHCSKKPVQRTEEWLPLAPTREKPMQQQRPGTAKNK